MEDETVAPREEFVCLVESHIEQLCSVELVLVHLFNHEDGEVETLVLQESVHVRKKCVKLTFSVAVGNNHGDHLNWF